jgi:hypothetical protein
MPFSRCKIADPDVIEAMRAAFYRVCEILQLSCDREDPLTEVVVTKIVELAKAGERDPEILCLNVLAQLRTSSQDVTPGAPPQHAPPPTTPVASAKQTDQVPATAVGVAWPTGAS